MNLVMAMALLATSTPLAVVTKPVANMYAKRSEDAPVVSQAIYGSTVRVLEQRFDWLRIRTADEYTGWLPVASALRIAPTAKAYASAGRVAQVESLFAHIYYQPDVSRRQPMLTVPFETRLEVAKQTESDGRWVQVHLPDDRSGWVQRGDISFEAKPISIEDTIAFSRRFLGLPYTWGGTSSFGYDCSGLTQMLCRRRGVLLPRDADMQAAWDGLVAVNREDLKPGDLLFFGSAADHITHTGMYLGDGKFINATTWIHPVTQICDLSDSHWSQLLVACRRLR
jgi:cell wall-associated NlpC family hydrolase